MGCAPRGRLPVLRALLQARLTRETHQQPAASLRLVPCEATRQPASPPAVRTQPQAACAPPPRLRRDERVVTRLGRGLWCWGTEQSSSHNLPSPPPSPPPSPHTHTPASGYPACGQAGKHGNAAMSADTSVSTDLPSAQGGEEPLFCLCRAPWDEEAAGGGGGLVGCEGCEGWFHPRCVGLSWEAAAATHRWRCPGCREAGVVSHPGECGSRCVARARARASLSGCVTPGMSSPLRRACTLALAGTGGGVGVIEPKFLTRCKEWGGAGAVPGQAWAGGGGSRHQRMRGRKRAQGGDNAQARVGARPVAGLVMLLVTCQVAHTCWGRLRSHTPTNPCGRCGEPVTGGAQQRT